MMFLKSRQVVYLFMLVALTSCQTPSTADIQTIALGTTAATTVNKVAYDPSENTLLAAYDSLLAFWYRDSATSAFNNRYTQTLTGTVKDAGFRDDGNWVAAVTETANTLTFLTKNTTNPTFGTYQTIGLGAAPQYVRWVG